MPTTRRSDEAARVRCDRREGRQIPVTHWDRRLHLLQLLLLMMLLHVLGVRETSYGVSDAACTRARLDNGREIRGTLSHAAAAVRIIRPSGARGSPL